MKKSLGLVLTISLASLAGCGTNQQTYSITFKNFDGVILYKIDVAEGTLPSYRGIVPTKESDDDSTYCFSGWNKEIVPATENTTYIAKFDQCYLITWLDRNGDLIESSLSVVGQIPECSVEMTTIFEGRTCSEFKGWSPEVQIVTEKATYQAVYETFDRFYNVLWLNYDGSTLEEDKKVERRSLPEYNSETPFRESVGAATYEFIGWDPEIVPITQNMVFTAQYLEHRNTHKIIFKDADGTILKEYIVDDGDLPVFDGDLPNRNNEGEYFYIFEGWDKEVTPAFADETYTAVYSKVKSYVFRKESNSTTYKIVYDGVSDSSSYIAANYFARYFKEITNIDIPILSNAAVSSNSNDQDYISFGETKFSSKYRFTYDEYDEACKPDYTILADRRVIVVDGGKFGVVYAAVELLNQMFDFDYLDPENYYYNKDLKSFCITNLKQKEFVPKIRYRENYSSGLIRLNSMLSKMTDYGYGRGSSSDTNLFIDKNIDGVYVRNIHNAIQLLPYEKYRLSHPEWYSNRGSQPCMSEILESEEALNIIINNYIEISKTYPDRYLVYSLCDTYATPKETACGCQKCVDYYHYFGSDSGVYMLLLNKLGDMIKQKQNEGKISKNVKGIMGTAYYSTHYAPTQHIDEVIAHDNVAMQVCPLFHNILQSFKETETFYFSDWDAIMNGKITNGFFYSLTDYSTGNYLLFHNDFDSMFDNYQIYKQYGLKYIIQLGTMNATNDYNFANLRSYLFSYITMHDDITKEDFDNQVRKYFDEYFGPAGEDMFKFFNKLKKSCNKFKYISTSSHPENYWHNAFTRVSYGSIKTTRPVTDINGYSYGIATNYDLLCTVDENKQVVLFSNNSTDEDYIGKYFDIIHDAKESLSVLSKSSAEYKLYEKRINLDSLVLNYINLECFNNESEMTKTEFKNFCELNKVNNSGETIKMSDLWNRWEII